ncbi:MAG: DUF4147 domain-containing protein, partial [Pseudomonadota bacterium]
MSKQPQDNLRRALLDLFESGVNAVKGDVAVCRYFEGASIDSDCYALAVGKAASAMMRGALQSLPGRVQRGLLFTKHDHAEGDLESFGVPLEIVEASHPVPNEDSLYAGTRLLDFIDNTPPQAHLLVLLSGGTSSL